MCKSLQLVFWNQRIIFCPILRESCAVSNLTLCTTQFVFPKIWSKSHTRNGKHLLCQMVLYRVRCQWMILMYANSGCYLPYPSCLRSLEQISLLRTFFIRLVLNYLHTWRTIHKNLSTDNCQYTFICVYLPIHIFIHPPICTVLQANASESLLSSRFLNLVCRHLVDLLGRWISLYAWSMPTEQLRDRQRPHGSWTHKPSVFSQHTILSPRGECD